MAKLIEFHIPKDFRRIERIVTPDKRGQVIEFTPRPKKSA
jgi:hypothetical protein